MEKLIVSILANTIALFIGAWELMLGIGVAHADWVHNLPTVGYGTAILLAALFGSFIYCAAHDFTPDAD